MDLVCQIVYFQAFDFSVYKRLLAPQMMPDVDDTAKAILTLYLIGRYGVSPQKMVAKFDKGFCFATYKDERNPSFSADL